MNISFPCSDRGIQELSTAMGRLTKGATVTTHDDLNRYTHPNDTPTIIYSVDAVVSEKHKATVGVDTWLNEGDVMIPPHIYFVAHKISEQRHALTAALTTLGFDVYIHPGEFWCSANRKVTGRNVEQILGRLKQTVLPILQTRER